jgi:hypothetical protein
MSSNSDISTKVSLETRLRDIIAGTEKHSPNGTFTFGGATYTAAVLGQLFQGLIDALDASDAARATWEDAVKKAHDMTASVTPVLRGYSSFLIAANGNASSVLADYGLAPRKARAPLTSAQEAAAAAKRKATRAARHTMGAVQKKAVKGDVTGVVVTPVVAPPPTVAPPTPAPAPAPTPVGSTTGGATPATTTTHST